MGKLLYFVAGVSIGTLVTFFTVKNRYEKKCEEEINDIREMYRKKNAAKELADKNSEAKKRLVEDAESGKTGHRESYTSIIDRYSGKRNVFSNPPEEDEIDNGADEDPYETIVDHTSPSDGYFEPFLITEDEFAAEKLFYDKVMVEYYTDGIAVLEETDEIIESIEELIGPDILKQPINDDIIYVRNDNRSTDYGIIFQGIPFVSEEGSS